MDLSNINNDLINFRTLYQKFLRNQITTDLYLYLSSIYDLRCFFMKAKKHDHSRSKDIAVSVILANEVCEHFVNQNIIKKTLVI